MLETTPVPFGRFVLHQKLGAGGMADVFRALPRDGGEPVVLKRIRGFDIVDGAAVRMFATEARITSLLRHPGIARTHELGEVDGEPYLVMELVEGIDLLRALRSCRTRKQPLSPALACHLMGELAAALGYAHALRDEDGRALEIVHRDVSPSNVMIGYDGQVKLVDFGIAKAAQHLREERTGTGVLKGKLGYISPEQVEGGEVDGRSDLFALGVVFHECLTLQRVLRGPTDLETLRLIRRAEVPAPSALVAGIPAELDAVVLRLMARTPAERFASGDELVAALAPLRARMPVDAAAVAAWLAQLEPGVAREAGEDSGGGVRTPASRASDAPELDDTPTDADSAVATNPRLAAWRRLLGPASLALALTVSSTLVALELRAPAPLAASSPTITLTPPATRETATLPALTAEAPPALAAATPPAPVAAASAARPAPAPAEPRFVRVHVRGQSGARALLDDAAVGVLPLDLEVPAVAHPRRLVVIAAGHRFAQEVPGDVDSFVLVEAVPSSNDSNSQAIAARAGIRKNRFAR